MDMFANSDKQLVCRVLMRSDGSVHICFPKVRSIEATPTALAELFTDPFEFIIKGSLAYKDNAIEINAKRQELAEVHGLTLVKVLLDKTIQILFPEVISAFLNAKADDTLKNQPLNMRYFEFKDEFADEKSYMIRFFLEATNTLKITPTIKRNIRLSPEAQVPILREIINALYADELPAPMPSLNVETILDSAENDQLLQTGSSQSATEMVSLTKYSQLHHKSEYTVRQFIAQGRIKSATKNENGHWRIDINDVPIEWNLKKARQTPRKNLLKRPSNLGGMSYTDVQTLAREKGYFSEAIISYLLKYEELMYYVNNRYREVEINGRPCLVIDVNPDYISSKTGKSNRELMSEGKAPVVPHRDKEEYVYAVHHLGQQDSSPFCLIPEYNHNSKEYSKAFHPLRPKEDLHTPEFYAICNQLWKTFLKMYDTHGKYNKIPYTKSAARKKK